MTAAAGGETRAGIGSRLRAAREKKGLTLLQAAERMHVDSRILESLEAEDFAALGAPVYARGHLRHYAELVDESPTELQALYAEATKAQPTQPDLTRIARAEQPDDSRRLAGPALVGVIAVAVIGLVWWVINLSSDKVQFPPARSTLASSSATAAPVAGGANSDDTNTTSPAGTEDNQGPVSQPAPPEPRAPSPASKPAAKAAAPQAAHGTATGSASASPGTPRTNSPANTASAPTNTAASAQAGTVTPVSNTPATVPNPSPRAKEGELTLRFSSDSWAEVYDASGQRLFYDVGTASSAHTVKGPAPLRVVLGNASGVALEYNGRPAPVPSSNQPDGSARFVINARGRAVPASAAAPNGD